MNIALFKKVLKLSQDKGARNSHKVTTSISDLVEKKETESYQEYWGEEVTLKKNWQSSPNHPKTFLAYITVEEAEYLRSLGLGYSFKNGKWEQHFDKHGIPSFNGYADGDQDAGGSEVGSSNEGDTTAGGGRGSDGDTGYDNPYSRGETPASAEKSVIDQSIADAKINYERTVNQLAGNGVNFGGVFYSFSQWSAYNKAWDSINNQGSLQRYGVMAITTVDPIFGYFAYDYHVYNATGQRLGMLAEAFADISELLGVGQMGVNESVALGIDVLSQVASIAMVGLPAMQTGLTVGAFGGASVLGLVGYGTAMYGAYSMFDSMATINDLLGHSNTINLSIAMDSSYNDMRDGTKVSSLIENANNDSLATKYLQKSISYDIASRGIFEKMAGGVVYQGVQAGDMLFDASVGANTSFCVGEPYSMSEHAKRIHSPYVDFEPKNQAGTKSFSVLL